MIPVIIIGGIVVAGLIASAVSAKQPRTDEPPSGDDPHTPPTHVPEPEPEPIERPVDPAPQPPSPVEPPIHYEPDAPPYVVPPIESKPPNVPRTRKPGRQDRIARLFVLDTLDEPIPPGGLEAIQHRYDMAADWVGVEVGKYVAYDPDITHLTLPYTSAEIRQIVLSSAAAGDKGNLNTKKGSPLFEEPRVPAPEFAGPVYPGGFSALIFDALEGYALAAGEPHNNPRNPDLIPLKQTWMFIVRGAGGYGGGLWWFPGKRESIGWGILGDATLSAWLAEAGLEKNIAHEVIFLEDSKGRQEWELDWDKNDITFTLATRLGYGTADAQTGSFIHESFHGLFAAIHVTPEDMAALKKKDPNDPRIALWAADEADNIMGGSHLDWNGSHRDKSRAKIHKITFNEMEEGNFWYSA